MRGIGFGFQAYYRCTFKTFFFLNLYWPNESQFVIGGCINRQQWAELSTVKFLFSLVSYDCIVAMEAANGPVCLLICFSRGKLRALWLNEWLFLHPLCVHGMHSNQRQSGREMNRFQCISKCATCCKFLIIESGTHFTKTLWTYTPNLIIFL